MLFTEFFKSACDIVIGQGERSGTYYLEPDYKELLRINDLSVKKISDRKISEKDLKEMLDLQVTKMNARQNKTQAVMEWLYAIIDTKLDPEMVEQENQLMENMLKYMKAKDGVDDEEVVEQKHPELPEWLSFSK